MQKTAKFFFDVGSPASYLAWTQMPALWDHGANLNDPAVTAATLVEAGAVARGMFGAPTVFVGDAMFFGQDRLDFVREALG